MKEEANHLPEGQPTRDGASTAGTPSPKPATARAGLKETPLERTRPRHWLWLLAAIVLEVAATTVMTMSHQWTFAHAGALGLALMWFGIALSYVSLARATTGIPVGVAFAFWEGLGLVLVSVAGVLVLSETLTPVRAAGLALVLVGALLVHRGTSHGDGERADPREGNAAGGEAKSRAWPIPSPCHRARAREDSAASGSAQRERNAGRAS